MFTGSFTYACMTISIYIYIYNIHYLYINIYVYAIKMYTYYVYNVYRYLCIVYIYILYIYMQFSTYYIITYCIFYILLYMICIICWVVTFAQAAAFFSNNIGEKVATTWISRCPCQSTIAGGGATAWFHRFPWTPSLDKLPDGKFHKPLCRFYRNWHGWANSLTS